MARVPTAAQTAKMFSNVLNESHSQLLSNVGSNMMMLRGSKNAKFESQPQTVGRLFELLCNANMYDVPDAVHPMVPGISMNTKGSVPMFHTQTSQMREFFNTPLVVSNGILQNPCAVAPAPAGASSLGSSSSPAPSANKPSRTDEEKAQFRAKQHAAALARKQSRIDQHAKKMAAQKASAEEKKAANIEKHKLANTARKAKAAAKFSDARPPAPTAELKALRQRANELKRELHKLRPAAKSAAIKPSFENTVTWIKGVGTHVTCCRLGPDGKVAPTPMQKKLASCLATGSPFPSRQNQNNQITYSYVEKPKTQPKK